MRAAELNLGELVSFEEGLVSLHGRRLILHDIHAMAQLRRDLVEALGLEHTRRLLARFGFFWGKADAAAMKRILPWESPTEWLRAGPRLQGLQGVGESEFTLLDLEPGGRVRLECTIKNSVEAEEQVIELGPSPEAGCWIVLGYVSGYASYCLGQPVYFQERTCRGRGDSVCSAVGMDRGSWGDQAEQIERRYQVEDIQRKIESLTTTLRKNMLDLARQRKRLRELESRTMPGLAETCSKQFQQVLSVARRVARFDTSVLITGESGVGKEVVARLIHESSDRRDQRFVAVSCSALPASLLESELFGHKAGSFTGATRDRMGLFEEAAGGTLLLDEVGEIKPELQVELLRVLQDKKIRRVGENRNRKIDVRVLAATNRNLQEDVRSGRFRDDLFYRLRVVEIHLPPLRERPEDIIPLARFFAERLRNKLKLGRLTLDPSNLPILESYPWPGNVRELENALERATVMSEDGWIRPEHLPPDVLDQQRASAGSGTGASRSLEAVERDHVLAVLESTGGNRTRAAQILGISPTTLWRKLKAWSPDPTTA